MKLLDPVLELNPLNDFGETIGAGEFPPFFLCGHHQLEDHRHRRSSAQTAFGFACPIADCGKDAFNRVGGPDVFPMFSWEVVERQQHVAIFG